MLRPLSEFMIALKFSARQVTKGEADNRIVE
jgi:hypothetical protein